MLTFRQVRLILFSLLCTFITTIKTVAYIIGRGILKNMFVFLSLNNVFQKNIWLLFDSRRESICNVEVRIASWSIVEYLSMLDASSTISFRKETWRFDKFFNRRSAGKNSLWVVTISLFRPFSRLTENYRNLWLGILTREIALSCRKFMPTKRSSVCIGFC